MREHHLAPTKRIALAICGFVLATATVVNALCRCFRPRNRRRPAAPRTRHGALELLLGSDRTSLESNCQGWGENERRSFASHFPVLSVSK